MHVLFLESRVYSRTQVVNFGLLEVLLFVFFFFADFFALLLFVFFSFLVDFFDFLGAVFFFLARHRIFRLHKRRTKVGCDTLMLWLCFFYTRKNIPNILDFFSVNNTYS